MAIFDDPSFSSDDFLGRVRLFPLPNLVLFPHVMQPLHIFEPRYRDLLEDALADDRLIAMAALAPGWERDYAGRPALYPTACLGRIIACCQLDDGAYNVLLLGLCRVRLLRELSPSRQFRVAEAELRGDKCFAGSLARQNILRRKIHEALLRILPILPEAEEQLDQLLGGDMPLGVLTDVVGFMLDIDLGQKQSLLAEVDVLRRAKLLLRHLSEVAASMTAARAASSFPPEFSLN